MMDDLLKRAVLVSNGFAFEVTYSEEFGKRAIKVTDCEDTRNIAFYFVNGNDLVEKVSNFFSEERYVKLSDNIIRNREWILEGYNEDYK